MERPRGVAGYRAVGRAIAAELVGTYCLTLVAAGGPTIAAIAHPGPSLTAQVIAPGALVMAMIYTIGPLSGAHINPAVTLAFTLRRNFRWQRMPAYWIAQFAGAVLAALTLRALFGNVGHLGATLPHHSDTSSFVMEIILTAILVTVILATAANYKITGHNAAIAVGGTVALAGLFAAPISGASMNPARSFGPAVVTGDLSTIWIYIAGPALGALGAVLLAYILRGRPSARATQVAEGERD